MFHYYWNLEDFLVEGIFQYSRCWSRCFWDHSEFGTAREVLFHFMLAPCFKTYLLCLQSVGGGKKFSSWLLSGWCSKDEGTCCVFQLQEALQQSGWVPGGDWGCHHCAGTAAEVRNGEDRGQGTVQGEIRPVSALPRESGCAPHHRVLWNSRDVAILRKNRRLPNGMSCF